MKGGIESEREGIEKKRLKGRGIEREREWKGKDREKESERERDRVRASHCVCKTGQNIANKIKYKNYSFPITKLQKENLSKTEIYKLKYIPLFWHERVNKKIMTSKLLQENNDLVYHYTKVSNLKRYWRIYKSKTSWNKIS